MAALIRRLGNFTKSFHSPTKPLLNLTFKSLSTKVSTRKPDLQTLVDNFKKSCEIKRFRHRGDLYTRHVKLLTEAKQFDMIEDILEHQKKFPDIQNEGFAIRLITLYGKSEMFEHARKLFDELPALGCPRTSKSFGALLNAGVDAKEFRKVIELFNDLPSAISVEPGIYSYTTLIQALCEIGSVDEALSKLRELGKEANIVTYNVLIGALYKNKRSSEAKSLWAEMEEKGIKPSSRSYGMRFQELFSEEKLDEAVLLAAEMRSKGIETDAYDYNTLIKGFCWSGNLEEAKKCYDDLQKSKCHLRLGSSYSTLILAYCETGDFDKAFEICSDALKLKIPPHSTLCKQVIDGLTKNGKTEDASELKKLLKPRLEK